MPLVETADRRVVRIPADGVELEGALESPQKANGIVVFAHGSGSSRMSPRNRFVARELRRAGFATLLMDLLTEEEDARNERRFDIGFLAGRLEAAVRWVLALPQVGALPLGLFGASTGGAAALEVAADLDPKVSAVVSRGGRPDLARPGYLERVRCPTLLIVGGEDAVVVTLNERAAERLAGPKSVRVVPGATHLFEEPGALEAVAVLATHWFGRYLARRVQAA